MRSIMLILISTILVGQIPLKYQDNISPTYYETMEWYTQLDAKYDEAKLIEYGKTDIGKPLHLFVLSADKEFDPTSYRSQNKCMIMVNNAIHPGEPCGVDASIEFAETLLRNDKIPNNVIIGIIPMYNIGGVLNRNSTTRANQNGPEEYGFRGNARNLDLNRDFVKLDSENAKSLIKIFHEWKPDFFIDTHTTNGADYQHIMTMINPHYENFARPLQSFVQWDLLPKLYQSMDNKEYPMAPYVSPVKTVPDSGLWGGVGSPRYSNGFTSLFNTFGFISEAHMFKTYGERVEATVAFLNTVLDFAAERYDDIIALRQEANEYRKSQHTFTLTWQTDTTKFELINFDGFEAGYKSSEVTGFDRLYYDRNKPWSNQVKVFNYFVPNVQIEKPNYYVIPQAWGEVIERLELNNIAFKCLEKDTVLTGEMYIIENVGNPTEPYNGHFPHSKIELKTLIKSRQFYKGDIIIPMNQAGNRYVIEVLEPLARDSFFKWNFFDSILDQREYFSPYIFEETAEKMLADDAELKREFDEKKANHEEFAKNARAQLFWLYQRSVHFESDYRLYPVMRMIE